MKKISLVAIVVISVFANYCFVGAIEGTGDDAEGTAAECGNFRHGFRKLCGNPAGSDGGGASWHIYSTSTYSGPSYYAPILDGDVTIETIKSNCPSSRYKWYAAYGWDGRNGAHWGPLKQGAKLNGRVIEQNSYNAMEYSDLYSAMSRGSVPDGRRISFDAANQLYQLENPGVNLSTRTSIGYFCVADPAPTYYSQSNASVGESYKSTGITNGGVTATVDTVNLEAGDTTSIAFSHNIFASGEASNVYWQMSRKASIKSDSCTSDGTHWVCDKKSYEILSNNLGTYEGRTDIKVPYSNGGQAKFIANTRPYSQPGGDSYVTRDEYRVKFKEPGDYKFCEVMYVDTTSKKSTEACVNIKVGKRTSYLSKSNVSNRGVSSSGDASNDDFKTTGIKDTTETARTDDIKIDKKGGKAYITFSHNVYSTTVKEGVPYKIERTVDGSSGISGNFSVKTPANSANSSNKTDGTYGGKVNFANGNTADGYFIGSPRPFTDGGYQYILRDYYEVEFPGVEGSYDFCETVYVGEGDEMVELTSACSKVVVGKGGDTIDPPVTQDGCAVWIPSTYTASTVRSGTTSVLAATKNATVFGENSDWIKSSSSIVWAKPYDKINWIHCYYPGAQKVSDETATKDNIHPHPGHLGGNYNSLSNIRMRDYSGWANWFRVTNQNLKNENYHFGSFSVGDPTYREWKDYYTIETGGRSRAGLVLTETNTASPPKSASASTSNGIHSWRCNPYTCNCVTTCSENGGCSTHCSTCYETCYHRHEYYPNSRDMSNAVDKATVNVPYNFENYSTLGVNTYSADDSGERILFSGEAMEIAYVNISVTERNNDVTDGFYATKVDDARLKLISYTSSSPYGEEHKDVGSYNSDLCSEITAPITHNNCRIIDDVTRQLNDPEDPHPGGRVTDTEFVNHVYDMFDAPAGEYQCVASAVYPYTVSGDTEMNASGSNTWYISQPVCVKIAKVPSLQVWGGSMYTAGDVLTQSSEKVVIAGYHDFKTPNSSGGAYIGVQAVNAGNMTIIGSWVEQAILAPKSSVSGLASGAATGYYGSKSGNFKKRTDVQLLGGSHEGGNVDFCIRSPLTIPNVNCSKKAGGDASVDVSKPSDKEALISRFTDASDACSPTDTTSSCSFRLDTSTSSLGNVTIPRGETRVYNYSKDTFNITGDIVYEDYSYQVLTEIPKVIIFAKNININCNVKRVDAVLIADGEVKTCSNSGNTNNVANANQLKIFGSVITDRISLKRSYGAAAGFYNHEEQLDESNQMSGASGQEGSYAITDGSAATVVPAEIIDYDTSLYLWGVPRANSNASGKLNLSYQKELSPRY